MQGAGWGKCLPHKPTNHCWLHLAANRPGCALVPSLVREVSGSNTCASNAAPLW